LNKKVHFTFLNTIHKDVIKIATKFEWKVLKYGCTFELASKEVNALKIVNFKWWAWNRFEYYLMFDKIKLLLEGRQGQNKIELVLRNVSTKRISWCIICFSMFDLS